MPQASMDKLVLYVKQQETKQAEGRNRDDFNATSQKHQLYEVDVETEQEVLESKEEKDRTIAASEKLK